MLLIGVVSPDKSANGMIMMKEKSIACCMVAATDENNNPIPMDASTNTLRPTYSVTNEPANGMRNQSCATSRINVACTIPTSMDGSALPAMISAGRNGVTSN